MLMLRVVSKAHLIALKQQLAQQYESANKKSRMRGLNCHHQAQKQNSIEMENEQQCCLIKL